MHYFSIEPDIGVCQSGRLRIKEALAASVRAEAQRNWGRNGDVHPLPVAAIQG